MLSLSPSLPLNIWKAVVPTCLSALHLNVSINTEGCTDSWIKEMLSQWVICRSMPKNAGEMMWSLLLIRWRIQARFEWRQLNAHLTHNQSWWHSREREKGRWSILIGSIRRQNQGQRLSDGLQKAKGPSRLMQIMVFRVWWKLVDTNTTYLLQLQCSRMSRRCL